MEKEIIKNLLSGAKFYNPNTESTIIFRIEKWSGNAKDIAKVTCYNSVDKYKWVEYWDDMDITIRTFETGEYLFVESDRCDYCDPEIPEDHRILFETEFVSICVIKPTLVDQRKGDGGHLQILNKVNNEVTYAKIDNCPICGKSFKN